MLLSIVEGSGSIAWRHMLVPPHSGEIAPTIKEAPIRVQLSMVKDPGVKLLWRWVRDEMAVPSLHKSREVGFEIHQLCTIRSLIVQGGGKGATHWLPEGSSSVSVGGTSFPGPGVGAKRGVVE